MRLRSVISHAFGLGILVLGAHAVANAAEVKVICTIGVKSFVDEMVPQFERAGGHTVNITYGVSNILKKDIEAGAPFDVMIMTAAVADDLIKQGKVVADTRTDIARGGIGLAVKAGASKPDIGTVEAFKRALLAAKSIASTRQGGSGIYFDGLLEKLGIAEQVRPKIVYKEGHVAELVATGEAEMAVQLVTELISIKGVELVGPFPEAVQNYITLTGGVGTKATSPTLAMDFLKFLTAPTAVPVIKAKGLEPGA